MKKQHRRLAAVALSALAFVATACNVDVSGGGTTASAINPTGKGALISFSFKTRMLCDNGGSTCALEESSMYSVNGSFRDSGKNAWFPSGVSLNFSGKLKGGRVRSGGLGGAELCDVDEESVTTTGAAPGTPGPVCFAGAVTYRSTNKAYPNLSGDPECNLFVGETSTELNLPPNAKTQISGVGLVVMVDSNSNGKPEKGDRIGFTSLCGPYSNRDVTVMGEPSGDPDRYSYATCVDGFRPELISDNNGGGLWDYLDEVQDCTNVLRSGNIKMTPITIPAG